MNGDKVVDIVRGEADYTGSIIETVFYKVSEIYAVYATDERVLVQYADDAKLGSEQRLALYPLNPIRGEINGLIDGWRAGGLFKTKKKKSMARRFDRLTADALTVALQGDPPHAAELLTNVRDGILEERTSIGRTEYLITASISALVVFLFFSWLSMPAQLPVSSQSFGGFVAANGIWLASGVGALGALFSIALGIRSRDIKTDLQRRDNIVDAILRILIGAVSAIILFSLFKSDLVALSLNGRLINLAPRSDATTTDAARELAAFTSRHMAIIIAFLAGFSERLVGDFLSKAVLVGLDGKPSTSATADVAAQSPQVKADANEKNPRGNPTAKLDDDDGDDHPDDHTDNCACGVKINPHELTDDEELPEASGGVAKPREAVTVP